MVKTNCLIVRAYGRKLDQLRGEVSRIIGGSSKLTRARDFRFEDAAAKKSFALICENFAVPCLDA
ncbi:MULTISPECIES: hypothetical protein [unclassified Bradyrhizobium]|uniref:Transposase n=1 Tax=Bradyrhizobium sp. LLZ17 TaxID=3239388 RepID=A0AB39XJC1_9BRAD